MAAVYQAPEVLRQCQPFDNKIDSWAFGCVLLEMTTQRQAFNGEGAIQKFIAAPGSIAVFNLDYTKVDKETAICADWVEELVNELLQVDANERPSARSVLERIDSFTLRKRNCSGL
jgi:serine/threonine protein kinase